MPEQFPVFMKGRVYEAYLIPLKKFLLKIFWFNFKGYLIFIK